MIIKIIIAAIPPYALRIIASYPNPSFSNSCPGKIESSVSVSGHPRKIDGIKSINVCVIAIAVINIIRKLGFILITE